MFTGLHPITELAITPAQYIKEFGRRLPNEPDVRPLPRCYACRQGLGDRAGRTDHNVVHFWHLPGSGFCPTKASAGKPYLRLRPTRPDPVHAEFLKHIFHENWTAFFKKLTKLVPCLSEEEFLELVKLANTYRVWDYSELEAWELPYVLVMLMDFPVRTSRTFRGKPGRTFWLRFWYDSTVRDVQDLWIDRPQEVKFFRAYYKPPKGKGVPGLVDLMKVDELTRDKDLSLEQVPLTYRKALDLIPRGLARLLPAIRSADMVPVSIDE